MARTRKTPTKRVTMELLETFRAELRRLISDKNGLRRELRRIEGEIRHNKQKTSEMYRLVTAFEKALEDKKIVKIITEIRDRRESI